MFRLSGPGALFGFRENSASLSSRSVMRLFPDMFGWLRGSAVAVPVAGALLLRCWNVSAIGLGF